MAVYPLTLALGVVVFSNLSERSFELAALKIEQVGRGYCKASSLIKIDFYVAKRIR